MRLRCRGEAEGSRGQGGSGPPGVTSRWAVPGDPASRVLVLTTSRTTFGTPRTLYTQGTHTDIQASKNTPTHKTKINKSEEESVRGLERIHL